MNKSLAVFGSGAFHLQRCEGVTAVIKASSQHVEAAALAQTGSDELVAMTRPSHARGEDTAQTPLRATRQLPALPHPWNLAFPGVSPRLVGRAVISIPKNRINIDFPFVRAGTAGIPSPTAARRELGTGIKGDK